MFFNKTAVRKFFAAKNRMDKPNGTKVLLHTNLYYDTVRLVNCYKNETIRDGIDTFLTKEKYIEKHIR